MLLFMFGHILAFLLLLTTLHMHSKLFNHIFKIIKTVHLRLSIYLNRSNYCDKSSSHIEEKAKLLSLKCVFINEM